MQFKSSLNLPNLRCKYGVSFLAFSWILGLLTGMYLAHTTQNTIFSLMRMAPSNRVSIVGLFVVLFLPLLLSACAVYLSAPLFLFPIALLKGLLFGFCSMGVLIAFETAGWLIRLLLMFSDSLMVVLLFWFWIRQISGNKHTLRRDLAVCTVFAVFIGTVDYILVSPFLAMLMNYY